MIVYQKCNFFSGVLSRIRRFSSTVGSSTLLIPDDVKKIFFMLTQLDLFDNFHFLISPVYVLKLVHKLNVGKKHKNTQNTSVVWRETCGKKTQKHIKHMGWVPRSKLGSNLALVKKHKNTQNTWVLWPGICGKKTQKHIKHMGWLPRSELGSN